MAFPRRVVTLSFLITAFLYAVVALTIFPTWTVDDAYILLRYAENLAEHGLPVWNIDRPPVEGFTGVVLPVLEAAGEIIGVPPMAVSKIVGVVAFLLGGWLLFLVARRLRLHSLLAASLSLLYFTSPVMFSHAYSGLETTLFTTSMLMSLWLFVRATQDDRQPGVLVRNQYQYLLSLLLLALVRPEGIVAAALFWLGLLVIYIRRDRQLLSAFSGRTALVLLIPLLAYHIWRWDYYGSLLPNTYYAKTLDSVSQRALIHMAGMWREYIVLPLGTALLLAVGAMSGRTSSYEASVRQTRVVVCAVLLTLIIVVSVQYLRSIMIMNFSYRHFMPFYPALLILFGVMAQAGLDRLSSHRRGAGSIRAILVGLAVMTLGLQVGLNVLRLDDEMQRARNYREFLHDEHVAAGKYLREALPRDETLIVVVDAGAIPYYADVTTIDFGGLNDAYLARQQPTLEETVDYFYSHDAGAVVFTSQDPAEPRITERVARIVTDPRMDQYELVRSFSSDARPGYHQLVYLRRDLILDR